MTNFEAITKNRETLATNMGDYVRCNGYDSLTSFVGNFGYWLNQEGDRHSYMSTEALLDPPPLPLAPDVTYLYEDLGIIRGIKRLINKMKGGK